MDGLCIRSSHGGHVGWRGTGYHPLRESCEGRDVDKFAPRLRLLQVEQGTAEESNLGQKTESRTVRSKGRI